MEVRRGTGRAAPPSDPPVAPVDPVAAVAAGATSPGADITGTTADTGADLVAAVAAALLADGAETDKVVERAGQIARAAGGRVELRLDWTTCTVQYTDRSGRVARREFAAAPTTVGMNRVMAVDRAVEDFAAGRRTAAQTLTAVSRARALPPANTALFAAACAVGAVCLAVIFGVDHWQAVGLIAVAAGGAGLLRRAIARRGGSNFTQVGAAALLAGLIGAAAVQLDLSSPLRLAAVCPCMVLVPGPHLLNGSFDLARLRIPLGIARLAFATLTLIAIGAGLLVGLTLGGAQLVLEPAGRDVPLLVDAAAAGVVAVCYGVFYSAPLRVLVWPFAVGAAVHALRWVALTHWHLQSAVAAGLACLVAGLILLPVVRRYRIPFSAIGFASVVSLMPGLLVFRTLAALAMLQDADAAGAPALIRSAVDDATVAGLTVLAMALGFLVAVAVHRAVATRPARPVTP
ncbi:threonine/serine exporter family protein [Nakamurella flavida]|uniref:Threonine/serine exporter family protein n=1 Tax=Nakamurella flavida TaxID=363630 RepID=A0A938YJY6_9ACTN|nr:threonine/serine exporter family protein [Nakamurella flavida]MBM9476544.1 threonine/serine exporter family protein [Nakamurella flavida]MDP9779018.1 uncharacterized membrane protein YjjP (DUF1212 family) [Nakamurella flavida]